MPDQTQNKSLNGSGPQVGPQVGPPPSAPTEESIVGQELAAAQPAVSSPQDLAETQQQESTEQQVVSSQPENVSPQKPGEQPGGQLGEQLEDKFKLQCYRTGAVKFDFGCNHISTASNDASSDKRKNTGAEDLGELPVQGVRRETDTPQDFDVGSATTVLKGGKKRKSKSRTKSRTKKSRTKSRTKSKKSRSKKARKN